MTRDQLFAFCIEAGFVEELINEHERAFDVLVKHIQSKERERIIEANKDPIEKLNKYLVFKDCGDKA